MPSSIIDSAGVSPSVELRGGGRPRLQGHEPLPLRATKQHGLPLVRRRPCTALCVGPRRLIHPHPLTHAVPFTALGPRAPVAACADHPARAAASSARSRHALRGDAPAVAAMLRDGVPAGALSPKGDTPLHWAAVGGHVTLMGALPAARADRAVECAWEETGTAWRPLHWAARGGQAPALRVLLGAGVVARDAARRPRRVPTRRPMRQCPSVSALGPSSRLATVAAAPAAAAAVAPRVPPPLRVARTRAGRRPLRAARGAWGAPRDHNGGGWGRAPAVWRHTASRGRQPVQPVRVDARVAGAAQGGAMAPGGGGGGRRRPHGDGGRRARRRSKAWAPSRPPSARHPPTSPLLASAADGSSSRRRRRRPRLLGGAPRSPLCPPPPPPRPPTASAAERPTGGASVGSPNAPARRCGCCRRGCGGRHRRRHVPPPAGTGRQQRRRWWWR